MTTGYPVGLVGEMPSRPLRSPAPRSPAPPATSAVRYSTRRRSRVLVASGVAVSAGLHVLLLFGFGPTQKKAAPVAAEENIIEIRLAIPDVKELEEPEPLPFDNEAPAADPGIVVPMQADVPQLARPDSFVQQINYASLLEPPDFSKLNVYAVPEHIRASGSKLGEQFGKIFNLSDLDRVPEPVLQPAPMFPVAMRREAESGTVVVEFIVDTQGRVVNPVVHESTHPGFDDAALVGVSRWKFRPGIKAGRKVNTRMRVPIVFKILDAAG